MSKSVFVKRKLRSDPRLAIALALAFTFVLTTSFTLAQTNSNTFSDSYHIVSLPALPAESLASINATELKTHVAFLASDGLGGRFAFSPSNRVAAHYLKTQLELYGYRGAARDGSFFQRVPLPLPSDNVLGILDGSDPVLRKEFIVISAHFDHLASVNGVVFNGADDNASGTAAVLEIAQAFALGPRPRRSVMIAFYTAEELGLVGSKFNTAREPVVPLARIVANFNLDMIGRSQDDARPFRDLKTGDRTSDRNAVYIVGDDKLSSLLRALSEATNGELSQLRLDYTYNNPKHPSRLYARIDSYNYARRGVPAITYFTGWHSDYHKPTDDLDKLDFAKMERIARLAFATSWRVNNLEQRLPIDKK